MATPISPNASDGDEAPEEVTPVEGTRALLRLVDELASHLHPGDRAFDRFLPLDLQLVSATHWTPLSVASRVAEWIDDLGLRTVVDIGSGAGKFCVSAALACRARFIGVEQRASLVSAAQDLARVFAVEDRVTFVQGTFGVTPLPEAEAYYLFNPFGENLFPSEARLDDEVELSDDRYHRDILSARRFLMEAPVGTYVFTYNGFGGTFPLTYCQVQVDRELPNMLRLFKKTARG